MDTIEKWIRKQLEEGYSPEQIKISLQKSGYDPAIVDRILNITNRRMRIRLSPASISL
jgi:SOS response regulatory protein OraA/RecX